MRSLRSISLTTPYKKPQILLSENIPVNTIIVRTTEACCITAKINYWENLDPRRSALDRSDRRFIVKGLGFQ